MRWHHLDQVARHDLIGYTKIPLIDPMAAQVCSAHAVLLVDTTQHTGDFAEKCQQGDAQRGDAGGRQSGGRHPAARPPRRPEAVPARRLLRQAVGHDERNRRVVPQPEMAAVHLDVLVHRACPQKR